MKVLLDTHVLLWWQEDDPRLKPRPRALISDSRVEVLVSVVSFLEMSIKLRIGKSESSGMKAWQRAQDDGFVVIGIAVDHLGAFEALPKVRRHRDPFDILLLAQAKAEGARLMTADRVLGGYGVPLVGVG